MNPVVLTTDPGPVLNLQQKEFSPTDVKTTFYWEPPDSSVSRFNVRWWIDGQDSHTVPTSIPSFTFHNLKSACQYSIQVSCVMFVNDEERSGVWSDVKTFGTSPNPPSRLTVCPGPHSPSTSFLIKYTDEDATGKKYVIEVTNLNEEVKQKPIQTEDLFALVDGLSPGGLYSVAVTCIKSGIRSLPCKLEVEKRTVPGKVAELRGQRSSTTSKTICWDKVIGADAYIVKWRKIDGNFQSTSTKETQITLQYLDSGKNYEVCVAAENATGTGDFPDAKQFSTDLASPSNLTTDIKYSGDNARAEVDFTAVGGQETKQYLVKLTPDESSGEEDEERPPKVIPSSTTHAVFTHLDHGSCFVPSVIAIGENGVESKEVFGTPKWTRPAPVQGLFSKTVSGSAEEIRWKEGKGVSSYIVLVREEGKDPEPQREITENRITLNSLSLNTKYAVSVAAKNEGGVGRFSEPVIFLTALTPPANIVVKNHPDYPEIGIIATWKGCSGAVEYNTDLIENTTDKKVAISSVKTECRKEFWKDVKAGHQYKVALQSIGSNNKRNSEIVYSDSIWTYCDRVQGLEVRLVSSSVVDITWKRTEEARNYQIICKARNGKIIEEKSETNQFTMTNLELGETYTVTIAAWNKAGCGKESEPKVFRTGFSQPSQVKVDEITPNSAKIQFTAPKNKPPSYSVLVMPLSAGEGMQPEVVKQNHCIVRNLEPGIEHQVQVWSCDLDSPHLDSEKTVPQYFITAPPPVKGIKVTKDSPVSRNAMWEPAPGSSFYIPKLRKAGYPPIVMDATEECECHLENLDLHSNYTFSVTAQNDGGKSKESDKINFETELNPPKGILVANDKASPTTDLNIQVQEPDIPGFNYRLRIICLNGEPDEFVTITRQEATSIKKICDLMPGNSYQLAVCSLHDKDENLNSKEIFSDVIQTKTPPLTFYLQKISNIKYKVTWCAIVGVTGYTIHFRKQYGDWIIKRFQSDENETILKDLEHGQIYEIKVFAVNESGPGQESQIKKFTTGPSTPSELNAEAISTREMKFSCKKTHGATEYIFDVNGEKYQEKDPELLLQHTKNDKEFDFKVSASNEGGCSDSSDTSHCSQTLLKLQQKSWKKANDYNTKFIIPMLSEVPSGNHADDFGRDEFQVGFGNTVCISGTHFSGKTSCALHYLQNLPKNLLPIFLDWDLYKGKKEKCDIKSVLLQQMKDFQESEKEFVFQWMKSHPDQVVFVVDDLALPHEVAGKIKLYDDVASVEEIFYSLVTTDREIFTQSQVLCSTSQSDLKQIIKPNRALQIDGFDTMQIGKMKTMELGEETDIPLPKHLEYFCKNPSFCMLILQLIKNNEQSVDMQSYSSVLMKIMIDSVCRYPDGKKKEKLRDLWKEIEDVPRKLKTAKIDPAKLSKKSKSTSSTASFTQRAQSQITDAPSFADFQENTPTKHCCTTLHDYITKALYFGLICPLEEFKSRFHKKSIKLAANANIWILAVGLLREHTTNLATELFSAIGHHLNVKEMGKKLGFTKNFVKENRDLIHKQMSSDCQITLDWLDIINETEALDIIPRSDWKVSVKKSHKTAEIEQMASFLCQVRGIFFNHIRVKMEKDLSPEARIPIDSAMKNNPDGEICANDSASTGRFSRNALNLSFRSKGRRPSGKPDLHSTLNSMEDDENDAVFGGNLSTSDDQTSHSQEEQRLSDSKDELKDASAAADTEGQKESGPI